MSSFMKSVPCYWLGLMLCLPLSPKAGADEKDALGDPLPPGAVARLGTLRMRHAGSVRGVTLSPDGKVVASAGGHPDQTVRLWSAETGKELRRLSIPDKSEAMDIAFSPDGTKICAWINWTNRWDLRIWDAKTGDLLENWADAGGRFVFSSDSKMLVSVRGLKIRVVDVANQVKIREITTPDRILHSMALSTDNKMVACIGPDKEDRGPSGIGVYELATGREVWKVDDAKQSSVNVQMPMRNIAFSPSGKTVAVASQAEKVHLYDARTGKEQGKVGAPATCIAYSPDGEHLALGFHPDRSITLWNLASGKEIRRFLGPGGAVSCLSFSRDGKTLASGCSDGSVNVWDVPTGKDRHFWPGHDSWLHSLSYLPDGRSLVSHGSDYTVRQWDTATGKEMKRFSLVPRSELGANWHYRLHSGNRYSRSLAVAPDGKTVAVCDPYRGLYLWDIVTGKERRLSRDPLVFSVTFVPEGKTLLSQDKKGQCRLWDPATSQAVASFTVANLSSAVRPTGGKYIYGSTALTPDGKTLLTQNVTGQGKNMTYGLHFWDLTNGKQRYEWAVPSSVRWLSPLSLSPDGKTLAFATVPVEGGHTNFFCDTPAGTTRLRLLRHPKGANEIAFSADGKLAASVGEEDGPVRVWEVDTGQEVLSLVGHWSAVGCVAFSPDGRTLASGGDDTTVLIWDLLKPGRDRLARFEKDPKECWDSLASKDAGKAYQAQCTLLLAGDKAVELLDQHLSPALEDRNHKTTQQLIENLNDEKFTVREAATRALHARGWEITPALHRALAQPASEEAGNRLKGLLTDLEKNPDTEWLRRRRAVQVLERIGTDQARSVLRKLASGVERAEQTRDAKAALRRLRK